MSKGVDKRITDVDETSPTSICSAELVDEVHLCCNTVDNGRQVSGCRNHVRVDYVLLVVE